MMKKERRRRRRINIALPIQIEYDHHRLSTATKNISTLGVYIESEKGIPLGTPLEIKIELPKPDTRGRPSATQAVKCIGITFRSQPTRVYPENKSQHGIGIFFRSFLEGGEKRLARFIDFKLEQEKKQGKIYSKKAKRRS